MENPSITLTLTQGDALVLAAFLTDFEDHETFKTLDTAYRMALYRLHAALEHSVDDLSNPDYHQLLDAAKAVLRGYVSE